MDQLILPPVGSVDVVLDTDAYNEADDQFAIAYLIKSAPKLKTKAIYAAPFFNHRSASPEDGMEKSYHEIFKVLKMLGDPDIPVFRGSKQFLSNEQEPVQSPAAQDLATRAMAYSKENPLYVVAIGAITNVASALLINNDIRERIVVVWLGGNALDYRDNKEFNLVQDIGAARVVFGCGVRLVQLPCNGVVSSFTLSRPDLKTWLKGTEIAEYLAENTLSLMDQWGVSQYSSKVIWDVTAIAWLLNEENCMMESKCIPSPIPEFDHRWGFDQSRHLIRYVSMIHTNALMQDMITKLTS